MNTDYFDWQALYERTHRTFPGYEKQPVIGISGNFGEKGCELAEGYFESVRKAGATPVILPPCEDRDVLLNTLERIDGLLLSGGGDLNPLFLNEEPIEALHSINPRRDRAELLLIRLAADRQIPMLGICRGIQLITAALGGALYQDIDTQHESDAHIKHSQDLHRSYASHTVNVAEGSLLEQLMGHRRLAVNSFHHQAVKDPGPHLRVCATAPDGVIEAVESTEHKSVLAVQWHPECFLLRGDESMLPLFRWLTTEAASFAEARRLHERIVTLDSHCDTPMFFDQDIHFEQRDPRIRVDLHKMAEGRLDASIMVAYLPQGERTEEALRAATRKADDLLTRIETLVRENAHAIGIARTPADIRRLKAEGRKALMLGIENGYAVGRDAGLVEHFRRRGVVYMTLCHNGDNDLCDSARGQGEHNGLSPLGRDVVAEMNRTGMLVDLSHASEKSFFDALETSCTPIVCSHSSCKALCDVPRNLSDDQLRALARRDGVAQITLYEGFLRRDGKASILDAVAHLNHAVRRMGIEHVGIGTDFDGDGGIPGCESAAELINLTRRLLAERYTPADLALLWGGNFLRVMEQAQQKAADGGFIG